MTLCSIIVTDTGPLKTLAYAQRLDLLLKPGLPVRVPDMVLKELEAGLPRPGNAAALEFVETCIANNLIEKVDTGVPQIADYLRSIDQDPGDVSVVGALNKYKKTNPGDFALLLFEDKDLARKQFFLPDNVFLLTTRPFLQELQDRGYVSSVEAILKDVELKSSLAGDDRKLLNRKKEHSIPPRGDVTVKLF